MKKTLLIIFSFFGLLGAANASVMDSVGVEKKNGKYFVKHQMESKETLYALSRKYNVTVAEIKASNPGVNTNDIAVGQIILIPAKNYKGTTSSAPSGSSHSNSGGSGPKKHKVQPKETVYSLARKYDVEVDAIKKANPELQSKGLQVGMELTIPGKGTNTAEKVVETKPAQPAVVKVEPKETTKEEPKEPVKEQPKEQPKEEGRSKEASTKKAPVAPLPSTNQKVEKVTENGFAEQAPAKSDAPDYYALHKTAPVGTIIQVTNEENGQSAYVRVIGSLGNSGSATLVQLSPKAMQRLNAKNDKVKVSLSYFTP